MNNNEPPDGAATVGLSDLATPVDVKTPALASLDEVEGPETPLTMVWQVKPRDTSPYALCLYPSMVGPMAQLRLMADSDLLAQVHMGARHMMVRSVGNVSPRLVVSSNDPKLEGTCVELPFGDEAVAVLPGENRYYWRKMDGAGQERLWTQNHRTSIMTVRCQEVKDGESCLVQADLTAAEMPVLLMLAVLDYLMCGLGTSAA